MLRWLWDSLSEREREVVYEDPLDRIAHSLEESNRHRIMEDNDLRDDIDTLHHKLREHQAHLANHAKAIVALQEENRRLRQQIDDLEMISQTNFRELWEDVAELQRRVLGQP